jgi:hypothetical protein
VPEWDTFLADVKTAYTRRYRHDDRVRWERGWMRS